MEGSRDSRHQEDKKTRPIYSQYAYRNQPRPVPKSIPGTHPGKPKRIKFTPEIFQACPNDRCGQPVKSAFETFIPKIQHQNEQTGKKTQNRPETYRCSAEDFPKPGQLDAENQHSGQESKTKGPTQA